MVFFRIKIKSGSSNLGDELKNGDWENLSWNILNSNFSSDFPLKRRKEVKIKIK